MAKHHKKKFIVTKYMRCYFVLTFLIMALSSCDDHAVDTDNDKRLTDKELSNMEMISVFDKNIYRFGFDVRTSPQEDARQYLPFLKYLERSTGYKFELRFTTAGENIASNLGSGKVQFAAIGAVSFIKSKNQHDTIAIARGINNQGEDVYRSYIVVRKDSPIKEVKGLRGRQFAFGSRSSTQGHLIPRIVLFKHDISLSDLAGYHFTGSHQNCADAVAAKQVDACGMQDTLAERLSKQGVIRILHRSEYFPSSGIAANRDVSEEVISKVKVALLKFNPKGKDAKGLYAWDRTEMPRGFTYSEELDYHNLSEWIEKLHLQEEE